MGEVPTVKAAKYDMSSPSWSMARLSVCVGIGAVTTENALLRFAFEGSLCRGIEMPLLSMLRA